MSFLLLRHNLSLCETPISRGNPYRCVCWCYTWGSTRPRTSAPTCERRSGLADMTAAYTSRCPDDTYTSDTSPPATAGLYEHAGPCTDILQRRRHRDVTEMSPRHHRRHRDVTETSQTSQRRHRDVTDITDVTDVTETSQRRHRRHRNVTDVTETSQRRHRDVTETDNLQQTPLIGSPSTYLLAASLITLNEILMRV